MEETKIDIKKAAEILKRYSKEQIEINENTRILEDLGMSSFDLMIVVCEMEKESLIEAQVNQDKPVETVGDLIREFNSTE